MMITLDTPTALVFMLCITTANSFIAFLLYKTQRNVPGLWMIATGHLILTLSLFLIGATNPHLISLHNTLALPGQCLIAIGITTFFGQRPRLWIPLVMAVFTLVSWEIILWVAPDQIKIRVAVATILLVLPFLDALRAIRHSDNVAPVARNFMVSCLILHVLVLLGRCALSLSHPDQNYVLSDPMRSIFFLEVTVLNTLFFYGVLIIVGSFLSKDLQQKAESLAAERRVKAELRQFLHILGHELRTPLAVIGRAVEMIETLQPDPPMAVANRLATVRSTVERVDALIHNLLTAERAGLEGGQKQRLDLTDIVSDAVATLAEKHGPNRLRLECSELPIPVDGDREMLSTAVINVLDNALKYSPAGTMVEATVSRRGEFARLRVVDHGIGFPPDQLRRIGERFFRADNAKTLPGTGLGLHIVNTIAARHDGRLEIGNAPGGGAEVTLTVRTA